MDSFLENFMKHFKFMERVLLFKDLEFFDKLLRKISNKMEKNVKNVDIVFVRRLFDQAYEVKGLKYGDYEKNFWCNFSEKSLFVNMHIILDINNIYEDEKKLDNFVALECFHITYKAPGDVELVLDRTAMQAYEYIFENVFYCLYIYRKLNKVIAAFGPRGTPTDLKNAAVSLHRKMFFFIESLRFHMLRLAIDRGTAVFYRRASKAKTMTALIEVHRQFLNDLLSKCMLHNLNAFRILFRAYNSCLGYYHFIKANETKQYTEAFAIAFQEYHNQFYSSVKSLCDHLVEFDAIGSTMYFDDFVMDMIHWGLYIIY